MPSEVNGNHAVARFEKAHVFTDNSSYYVCGEVVITPFFVFVTGHYGEGGLYAPIVSKAIPVRDIYMIDDRSVESCETHDEMDAEAKALMEAMSADAEKTSQN